MSSNLLSHELSPYLLQHAGNPVHWRPWSEEAFEEARRRDVPILLSIGYSSCHWCHVMEHESFSDPATAGRMNELLVCVKIDREERPDVDALHMEYVQRLSGRGGWPLNVFVTPDRIPFYGGTYFPPVGGRGAPSWTEVVEAVSEAYRNHRDEIVAGAEELARELSATGIETGGSVPSDQAAREGLARQIGSLDPAWGGFPGAPKFPPHGFLAHALSHADLDDGELSRLRVTLDRISLGGIRDHVEGGFARYSTDPHWIVPHFEKMLYDNAQLLGIYARAASRFSEPRYARVARDTAAWMRRELGDPAGGLRSSVDADSQGREGAHAVWTWAELRELLGEDMPEFARRWNVRPEGNFEGANVLWMDHPGHDADEAASGPWRAALAKARSARPRPAVDDKVLASWNGLAISGLATAAFHLEDDALLAQARSTARFCLDQLVHPGGLHSVWRGGLARGRGTLEDWAFLGEGFLELWQVSGETAWLDAAVRLADGILERFTRDDSPALRFSDLSGDELFAQVAPLHDGPTPSGNGAAARLLARLWHATGRRRYRDAASGIVSAAGDALAAHPRSFAALADARRILSPSAVLVHVEGLPSDPEFRAMASVLRRSGTTPDAMALGARAPLPGLLRDGFCGSHAGGSGATGWLCRGNSCLPPARTPGEFERLLREAA